MILGINRGFVDDLYKLSFIVRYNTHPRVKDENVATHSYYVTLFTKLICDRLKVSSSVKLEALELALVHDISEYVTNDITYDAKQAMPEIRDLLVQYEKQFVKLQFPEIYDIMFNSDERSQLIQTIVKVADIMSVNQYCRNEVMLGNEAFQSFSVDAHVRLQNILNKLEGMLKNAKEQQPTASETPNENTVR